MTMTRDAKPALADEIDRAARLVWEAVPDYLRRPKQRTPAHAQPVPVFSDRRSA